MTKVHNSDIKDLGTQINSIQDSENILLSTSNDNMSLGGSIELIEIALETYNDNNLDPIQRETISYFIKLLEEEKVIKEQLHHNSEKKDLELIEELMCSCDPYTLKELLGDDNPAVVQFLAEHPKLSQIYSANSIPSSKDVMNNIIDMREQLSGNNISRQLNI